MSSPIKVGSGYIEVTPRLSKNAVDRFQTTLNRRMALMGGNAGRAMGASLTTAMSKRLEKELPSLGRVFSAEATKAGTAYGESLVDAITKTSKGRITFADAADVKRMRRSASRAGKDVAKDFSNGLASENDGERAFVKNFRAALKEARLASREAMSISHSANIVRRQSRNLLQDFVSLETAFADQFAAAMRKASVVSHETVNAQRDVARTLARTRAIWDELNATVTHSEEVMSRGLRNIVGLGNVTNQQLRNTAESVRQWSNRMQGFGQDWSLFITAPIAGSLALVSVWGLQVGAELEKARIGIQRLAETAGHSLAEATALANAQLADLRQFAEDSTFEFAPLANGVQRLMAAGVEAETATEWLKVLGDTTAAYGAGADEMRRAVIGMSQSMASGKIYAQDMNQLNNAGIPVWRLMAEATGQSEAALRKLGREGKLLADDIWPQLIEEMSQYNGTAADMANTVPLYAWQNAVERFRNSLGDLINGTDETMEIVNPERPAMWIELFNQIEETLTRIVPTIGGALDFIVPHLTQGFEALNGFLDSITNGEGEISNFGVALLGIAAFLGPVMVAVGFIGRGIASLISGLRLLPDNVASLNETVEKLVDLGDGMDNVGSSASEMSGEITKVGDESQTLRERIKGVGDYLGSAASSGWSQGTDAFDRLGAAATSARDRVRDFSYGTQAFVVNRLIDVNEGLSRAGSRIADFGRAAAELPGRVNDGFTRIMDRVNDLRVDVRDMAGFVKLQMPQSWGEASDMAKAALEDLSDFTERKFNQIRESGRNIVVTIRQRYEEAGGIRGIARSGVQAVGRGAQAAGRGAVAAARGTFGAVGALMSVLDSVLGPALESLQKILAPALEMLAPVFQKLAEAFGNALLPALTVAIVALTPALLAFTPILEQLGEILGPVIEELAAALGPMIEQMVPIIGELLTQLSPFLSEIAGFIVEVMGALAPILGELLIALMPVVEMIAGAFLEALNFLLPVVTSILGAISPLVPIIGDLLMSAIETLLPIVFQLFEAFSPLLPVLVMLLEAVMPIIEALMPLIELIGTLLGLVVSILAPIIELAATILAWLIEKALVPLIGWIADAVEWVAEKLGPKIEWLSEKLVDFTEVVRGKFEDFREKWDEIWDALGDKAQDIYDNWIKPVVDGVGEAWDKVTGLFSGDPDEEPERRAQGGVIPGYAPGIDSVPALLSPGEGILRPEVVRWLGKSTIDRWNAGAMSGAIPRFAAGGIVGASKAATDAASAVLSGPVLATPVPEAGKMLEGLVGEYEAATGDIATDWQTSADKVTGTTIRAMDDVTSSSREALGTLTERVVRPAMRQSESHVRSGMRGMTSEISDGWSAIQSTTRSRADSIVSTIRDTSKDARDHWRSMVRDMNRSTEGLVNTSYSKGIVGVLSQMSSLAGVSNPLRPVYLSTGGILPGYQPGIDTVPAMLSAGEAVLRPEVTRMLGPELINAWNRAAMNGEISRFSTGGIVDGRAWVRRHQDDPYEGYTAAFKAAVKDLLSPSLDFFASLSGGYGPRGADDVRSGFPGVSKWLGLVDKAANSGGSARKVIDVARREYEIGATDRNRFNQFNGEAWCADFVSWVVDKAKANKAYWNSPKGTPGNRWPAVATWERASSRAGDYHFGTRGIQPGDIVTYGSGGQHINIVEKVLGGGFFQTIGGNESDTIRRTVRSSARGYGRPRWGLSGSRAESGPFKGLTVKGWPGQFADPPGVLGGGIDPDGPEDWLAKGAVINSPTRAVIGEAGREAVIPLTDQQRAATLLEEIGLPHKAYHFTINAAPNVPTEESIIKAMNYADTIYG
ncbi:tape measure protein [Nocardiopsis sp. NPDC049922]|uniref:tape measure protein n=1 Tax=Nocardiopsis sp. NPDC049922 TaxID=3155157 RepID=UPI0033CAA5BD